MRPKLTLAGQFLAFQLVIGSVVLVAVAAVSLAQSTETFRRDQGHRMLSIAENVATTRVARLGLTDPAQQNTLPPLAEGTRSVSGASFVIIARPDRTILTSPDPRQVGRRLPLGESRVASGRAWTGVVTHDGITSVVAHVPVIADDGRTVGLVAVGQHYPSFWQRLRDATPNLLSYLGLASALGVLGSWLLARRVKRQTLGLEPREIAGLVEHREAMLHGIKEGVVGLDPQRRIVLVNDSARDLLDLPADCVGRTLDELDVDPRLYDVLTGAAEGADQLVLIDDRVLTLNRMPMSTRGTVIGSVTTLRDLTELAALQRELGATRNATDTLRAQTHEFSNQLHTISGLIQLGEYDEVVRFVSRLSQHRAQLNEDVTTRIADPAVAALVIAKASLAAEQGVELRLAPTSRLGRVDDQLSADLTTVVGNLIDNALDAIGPAPDGWVEVELDGGTAAGEVRVVVQDSGPGVAPELAEEVFRQGFSTKNAGDGGKRGFGLALTRLVCARRGGDVSVCGAVFTARIPVAAGAEVGVP
jgi:sensor histidine kinase regulating citrate/malate metabolism